MGRASEVSVPGGSDVHDLGLPLRLSVFALFCGLGILLYAGSVVLHVLPRSPATHEARGLTDRILGKNFRQTWTLFAPNPPQYNIRIYVQVRCLPQDGDMRESAIGDLGAAVISRARQRPLFESRLRDFTVKLDRFVVDHNELYFVLRELAQFDAPVTQADIDRRARSFALTFRPAFIRFVSAGVRKYNLIPGCVGADNVEVRGRILQSPIRPYSKRHDRSWKGEDRLVYDSGWERFSNVATWK